MKLKNIGSNMTELHTEDGAVVLFSYSTPVAAQLKNGGFVRTNESYSRTTTRHINKWLDGRYALAVDQREINAIAEGKAAA
jgi:hypothetical protein